MSISIYRKHLASVQQFTTNGQKILSLYSGKENKRIGKHLIYEKNDQRAGKIAKKNEIIKEIG